MNFPLWALHGHCIYNVRHIYISAKQIKRKRLHSLARPAVVSE